MVLTPSPPLPLLLGKLVPPQRVRRATTRLEFCTMVATTKAEKTTKATKVAVWRPRLALKTTPAVKAMRAKAEAERRAALRAERRAQVQRATPRERGVARWYRRWRAEEQLRRRTARLQVHIDALMQRILDPQEEEEEEEDMRRGVFIEDPDVIE